MANYHSAGSELDDVVEEPLLATAQWMPPAQVADRYIFEDGDLWLGRNGDDKRTPIGRKDDSHVLLCAKTRSGKGRALITNNLLLWPGSVFVNDPKGENASVTAARRGNGSEHATESLGQKVCVLDSHETATVDPEYRAYYNPIAEIQVDDPDAETKAALIAESCVCSENKTDVTWDNKAKTFIKALVLHVASDRFIPPEMRNLVTVRKFILSGDFIALEHIEDQLTAEQLKANPPDGFMLMLEGMKQNKAFHGIISDQARSLFESFKSQPKMWNSIRTSAEEHTDWIDDGRMRSVLAPIEDDTRPTFTADELQSRAGGISVYVCLPSGMKDRFAAWPRIIVNMMLAAAQASGNRHPATGHQTLMMLDEFASMERMRKIETAAADIAGAGVKMFFVVQTLGQLKAKYGENWETFVSSADTHIYYGFNDGFTAEYVSKRLGEVEVIRTTRSQSTATSETTSTADMRGGSSSTSQNRSTSWNNSTANSVGGGTGSSSGGSSGTTNSIGWGPSIFLRTLATTDQFSRQAGRNYGTSRQENYNRTATKGKSKTKGSSSSEGNNWSSTTTHTRGTTQTHGSQQSIHKRPLASENELMKLFGDVEDENDPTYPGIGLISTASQDPMLIQKCNYDEDRFFERLFDPHPKWGFAQLPLPILPKPKNTTIRFSYRSENFLDLTEYGYRTKPIKKGEIAAKFRSILFKFPEVGIIAPEDIETVDCLNHREIVFSFKEINIPDKDNISHIQSGINRIDHIVAEYEWLGKSISDTFESRKREILVPSMILSAIVFLLIMVITTALFEILPISDGVFSNTVFFVMLILSVVACTFTYHEGWRVSSRFIYNDQESLYSKVMRYENSTAEIERKLADEAKDICRHSNYFVLIEK